MTVRETYRPRGVGLAGLSFRRFEGIPAGDREAFATETLELAVALLASVLKRHYPDSAEWITLIASRDNYYLDRLLALEAAVEVFESIAAPKRRGRKSRVANALAPIPPKRKPGRPPRTDGEDHREWLTWLHERGADAIQVRRGRVTAIAAFREGLAIALKESNFRPRPRQREIEDAARAFAKEWSALKNSVRKLAEK